MVKFEIGVVYQKSARYYIAVSENTLVTCRDGSMVEVRPTTKYDVVRTLSVEKLCEHWDIDLFQFDHLMKAFLAPSAESVKTRPRGTRRKKDDDSEYWRRHRTGRIARPKL